MEVQSTPNTSTASASLLLGRVLFIYSTSNCPHFHKLWIYAILCSTGLPYTVKLLPDSFLMCVQMIHMFSLVNRPARRVFIECVHCGVKKRTERCFAVYRCIIARKRLTVETHCSEYRCILCDRWTRDYIQQKRVATGKLGQVFKNHFVCILCNFSLICFSGESI